MRGTRVFTVLAAVALIGVACEDDSTGIPAGLEVYTATLNGANERPDPVSTTAQGTAIVTVLGNQLTWKVDITSAIDSIVGGAGGGHIHHGVADSAGPPRVFFNPAATGIGFTGTATEGSLVLSGDSVKTWLREGAAYVNIHTRAHQGGEIRGQLQKVQ